MFWGSSRQTRGILSWSSPCSTTVTTRPLWWLPSHARRARHCQGFQQTQQKRKTEIFLFLELPACRGRRRSSTRRRRCSLIARSRLLQRQREGLLGSCSRRCLRAGFGEDVGKGGGAGWAGRDVEERLEGDRTADVIQLDRDWEEQGQQSECPMGRKAVNSGTVTTADGQRV